MISRAMVLLAVGAAGAAALGGCNGQTRQMAFQAIIENAKRQVYPTLVFVKPIRSSTAPASASGRRSGARA